MGEQQLRETLERTGGAVCDDCLFTPAGYSRRQGVRSACRRMASSGLASRGLGVCSECGRTKTVTTLSALPVVSGAGSSATAARAWTWEGNVQAHIAAHLARQGIELLQVVDTASKAPGVDIIAEREGRELWITVKGYPAGTARTNPATQSRHWFSHAMFDVVRYRTERRDIDLGVGLPDSFVSYANLAKKAAWLKESAPFTFFWVAEDGSVKEE